MGKGKGAQRKTITIITGKEHPECQMTQNSGSEHLSLALSAFPGFPDPSEIPKKAQAVFPQWDSLTRRIKKHHIVSCIEMAFVTQH